MLTIIALLLSGSANAQTYNPAGYYPPTYQAPSYQAAPRAPVYNTVTSDQGTTTVYKDGERAMHCYTTDMGTTRCQ
jgi:hypothetical protein